jgi:Citrate lyase beta subunit
MHMNAMPSESVCWSNLRSILFVPVTSTHLFAKATQRGADALILDLEDGVPLNRKDEARQNLGAAVQALTSSAPILVRVNSDPVSLAADLRALPLPSIAAVMLPKAESAYQVQSVAEQLARLHPHGKSVPLIPVIETPLGVVRVDSIATAHDSVVALGFGAEDYATEMSVEPTSAAVQWAAQVAANAAHAFKLASLGLPGSVAETADMASYGDLVSRARDMGFTGTVCIHPVQVPIANKGFSPTEAQLEWARKVAAAGSEAESKGLGAVILEGRMLDRPIIDRALQWLSKA